MKNTLKAYSELYEHFKNLTDYCERMLFDHDNGEKDYVSDYKKVMGDEIDDIINGLNRLKADKLGKKKTNKQ